jgi:hypothetical protein
MTLPPLTESGVATALPYGDLPARCGVSVERSPRLVRVIVPPVPGWLHFAWPFHAGIVVLATLTIAIAIATLRSGDLAALGVNVSMYGLGLVCVLAVAIGRLRRRLAIEVTSQSVAVTTLRRDRAVNRVEWPRASVSEIKVNPFSGKLMIRIAHTDAVEWFLGPNREVNETVAAILADALRTFPPSTSATRDAPSEFHNPPRGVARAVLLTVGTVFVFIAVAMLVFPWQGRPLAC